ERGVLHGFRCVMLSLVLLLLIRRPLGSSLFPYTTLFRSRACREVGELDRPPDVRGREKEVELSLRLDRRVEARAQVEVLGHHSRSEEHTSELQSRRDLVCRLLLEKKNSRFCDVKRMGSNT